MLHAERNKWLDTGMYDAAEISDNRRGENEYFAEFVCLNKKGKIQAKMIKEFINKHGMKISQVISSPSCRARQTAEIAFERYDKLDRDLVHVGPYAELKSVRTNKLINLYKELPIYEGKNTIVSSHNGVIHSQMFEI